MLGMLQFGMARNREKVAKHTEEISSGYRAQNPSDTSQPGLIDQFREKAGRMQGHLERIQEVLGNLDYQEKVLGESENVVQRALELAAQGASETYSIESRASMAKEVFGLRDQLVSLANSTYQGVYVFGGGVDDTPPFEQQETFPISPATPSRGYENPASGPASERYIYNAAAGASTTRTVEVSDTVTIRVNAAGSNLFSSAMDALERLGRALEGYRTDPAVTSTSSPVSPDGSGAAYTFPAEFSSQSADIRQAIDLLKSASRNQISVERSSLGARMNQLQSAKSVVEVTQTNARESLSGLQDADIAESATNLTQARTALEASMTVSGQVLRLTILDYL